MQTFNDILGQPITAGSFIAYGHALGRSAGIKIGKVLAVKPKKPDSYGYETARITVQGVDYYSWRDTEPWRLSKKGTLGFPDRIVVLPADKVPAAYRALLDPIPVL